MAGLHWNDQNVIVDSNANGTYRLYPNGILWCFVELVLEYADSITLAATWTFPAEFDAPPLVWCTPGPTRDIAEFPNNVVNPQVALGAISETQVTIQLNRIPGVSGYDPGDTWNVWVVAAGEVASP